MNDKKWTAEPWAFVEGADNLGEQDDNAVFALGSVKGGGKYDMHICRIWNDINDDDEMIEERANAHLIAASPELYAALERLYGRLLMSDRDGECRITAEEGEMAEFALKKARGEL